MPVKAKRKEKKKKITKVAIRPLDERKREASRRHKIKIEAEAANISAEDYVMKNYGVPLAVYVTDKFYSTIKVAKGHETSRTALPAELEKIMETIDVMETNMSKVSIDKTQLQPIPSGTAIDRLLSRQGGVLPGTVNIITGEPSAGKTTICAAYLIHARRKNKKLAAGILNAEMSLLDWEEECDKNPALREVPVIFMRDLNKYKGNDYLAAMRKSLQFYKLCVVDSLAVLAERIKDATGMSIRDAMFWLVDTMNELAESEYRTYFVIQHFSKGLEYIGPTKLKHDTTSMAYVLFDKVKKPFIIFNKNRRSGGLLHVPLYTLMDADGLLGFDEARFNDYMETLNLERERDVEARRNTKSLATVLDLEQDFIDKLNKQEELDDEDL